MQRNLFSCAICHVVVHIWFFVVLVLGEGLVGRVSWLVQQWWLNCCWTWLVAELGALVSRRASGSGRPGAPLSGTGRTAGVLVLFRTVGHTNGERTGHCSVTYSKQALTIGALQAYANE